MDHVRPLAAKELPESEESSNFLSWIDVSLKLGEANNADAGRGQAVGESVANATSHRYFKVGRRQGGRQIIDVSLRPTPVAFSDKKQDFRNAATIAQLVVLWYDC